MSDKQLTGVPWIWLRGHRNTANCYVAFRRRFRLKEAPRETQFHVSAYTHYRLYLNGIEIGWGPNPSSPAWYYYDTYEVASHLRRGNNIIAVLAYNHGYDVPVDTAFAGGVGGALVFKAEMRSKHGPVREIVSDESWKAQRSPAWDGRAPHYAELRHGFKEYVDGRKGALDFVKPSYDDSRWRRARVLGKQPMEPFKRLLPREIEYF